MDTTFIPNNMYQLEGKTYICEGLHKKGLIVNEEVMSFDVSYPSLSNLKIRYTKLQSTLKNVHTETPEEILRISNFIKRLHNQSFNPKIKKSSSIRTKKSKKFNISLELSKILSPDKLKEALLIINS